MRGMTPKSTPRLDPVEKRQVLATGALADRTLANFLVAYETGEWRTKMRPIVLYRLKAALFSLKLDDRFPELFRTALGGAAEPNPREILEPADVEEGAEQSPTVAV
jgi:hypothetical protein